MHIIAESELSGSAIRFHAKAAVKGFRLYSVGFRSPLPAALPAINSLF